MSGPRGEREYRELRADALALHSNKSITYIKSVYYVEAEGWREARNGSVGVAFPKG